jgi:hypothetical protein
MTIKKGQSIIGNWFWICSQRICHSSFDVKPMVQSEQCAPYCAIGNYCTCPLANYCTWWRCNFKGLSEDGGRADFSKNFCASLYNEDLSIEPNFGQCTRHHMIKLKTIFSISLTLLPKGVQTKYLKRFLLKIFFHMSPVSTTLVVHLEQRISPSEFYKNFEMFLTGYSGAWGKLIHEKNSKSKI